MQRHTDVQKNTPEIGKTYTCVFNNTPLYDAIVEQAQGCWATVKIVQPFPGKFEKQYTAGQTFDIKVQYYDFVEKMA